MTRVYKLAYELRPTADLGPIYKQKIRPGHLLRIESNESLSPLYFDLPLEGSALSLEQIVDPNYATPLKSEFIRFSSIEAEARNKNIDLQQDLKSIHSHALVLSIPPAQETDAVVKALASTSYVKIKMGGDMPGAKRFIEGLSRAADIKVRLDFNLTRTFADVVAWWKELGDNIVSKIDLVEDPIPWNVRQWQALTDLGIPCANDFALPLDRFLELPEQLIGDIAVVFKPLARSSFEEFRRANDKDLRCIFTHGMESKVGRLLSVLAANDWCARVGKSIHDEVHGLRVGNLYDNDFLNESDSAPGFGFHSLLSGFDWREV